MTVVWQSCLESTARSLRVVRHLIVGIAREQRGCPNTQHSSWRSHRSKGSSEQQRLTSVRELVDVHQLFQFISATYEYKDRGFVKEPQDGASLVESTVFAFRYVEKRITRSIVEHLPLILSSVCGECWVFPVLLIKLYVLSKLSTSQTKKNCLVRCLWDPFHLSWHGRT